MNRIKATLFEHCVDMMRNMRGNPNIHYGWVAADPDRLLNRMSFEFLGQFGLSNYGYGVMFATLKFPYIRFASPLCHVKLFVNILV